MNVRMYDVPSFSQWCSASDVAQGSQDQIFGTAYSLDILGRNTY